VPTPLSFTGALTGERALEQLLQPIPVEDPDTELCLNLHAVDRIDVTSAVAARMRIQRHLREHPQGWVTIWPPQRAAVAARFFALLGAFPERVHFALPEADVPGHAALLPATEIVDSDRARLIGEVVLDKCAEAGISERRAAFATVAVLELADNAVTHAADALDPPVAAVASVGRDQILEVAVIDAGTGIAELENSNAFLTAIRGRALSGERGFLAMILNKAGLANVDVTVRIWAGTGRLLWTPYTYRSKTGRYVPGTTVIVRIAA
jgi:anti-sigma regulatory factor (Ser/Thr protein kinase)